MVNIDNSGEFVKTHVILVPGASEVGLGAVALAPLCLDPGGSLGSGAEPWEATFSAQAWYLRAIC